MMEKKEKQNVTNTTMFRVGMLMDNISHVDRTTCVTATETPVVKIKWTTIKTMIYKEIVEILPITDGWNFCINHCICAAAAAVASKPNLSGLM